MSEKLSLAIAFGYMVCFMYVTFKLIAEKPTQRELDKMACRTLSW